ncbi:MAG: hypothetical protein LRY35_06410 [Clostridiales bacterium]|nr:hypothetical protein [Clostridiales bacterium]
MAGLLETPVTDIHGVAGKRAAMLARLGITTWYDLVTWYPRDFEDWSSDLTIAELTDGQEQSFVAVFSGKVQTHRKGRLTILRGIFRDQTGAIRAVWFNQPWIPDRLFSGESYRLFGKVKRSAGQFTIQSPAFEPAKPDSIGQLRPIYPLTEGLTQASSGA